MTPFSGVLLGGGVSIGVELSSSQISFQSAFTYQGKYSSRFFQSFDTICIASCNPGVLTYHIVFQLAGLRPTTLIRMHEYRRAVGFPLSLPLSASSPHSRQTPLRVSGSGPQQLHVKVFEEAPLAGLRATIRGSDSRL